MSWPQAGATGINIYGAASLKVGVYYQSPSVTRYTVDNFISVEYCILEDIKPSHYPFQTAGPGTFHCVLA
jgi:hypothetical protein